MTTLAEMMLEIGRFCTLVSEGTATAGSTTSLTDTNNLTEPGNYWGKATLFLKTCTQTTISGTVVNILSFGENKLTFGTLSKTITAGDTYGLVYKEFSRNELKNAVLGVLRSRNAQLFNEATAVVSGQVEYSLPTGVRNVHKVQIKDSAGEVVVNQHWHEINSKLVFPSKYAPSAGTMQIIYCAPQGEIAETASIDSSYDFDGVKWSAVVNLLREKMNRTKKDDVVLMDLLSEATKNEERAWKAARQFIPLDMRLA
jgi:hypothetical protein